MLIHRLWNTIGESRTISHPNDTKLLAQQVAANPRRGRDFPLKLLWRLRRWKFIGEPIGQYNCEAERTSLSTAKATSSTQGPQTCTEAVTKYCNYTVNETDEEREHRLPRLPKATRLDPIRQRLWIKFTVKITFFDAAIGSQNCARQQYFSNGLGTADQPLHHEQQRVL